MDMAAVGVTSSRMKHCRVVSSTGQLRYTHLPTLGMSSRTPWNRVRCDGVVLKLIGARARRDLCRCPVVQIVVETHAYLRNKDRLIKYQCGYWDHTSVFRSCDTITKTTIRLGQMCDPPRHFSSRQFHQISKRKASSF